jgi:hypothetical protein
MIPFTLLFKGNSGLMVNIDSILYYTYRITCCTGRQRTISGISGVVLAISSRSEYRQIWEYGVN